MQAFSSSVNKGALKLAPKKQSTRLPRGVFRRNTHSNDAIPPSALSADDVPRSAAQDVEASSGTVSDGATKLAKRTVPVVVSLDVSCADKSLSAAEKGVQERRRVAHDEAKEISTTKHSSLDVQCLSSTTPKESIILPAEKCIQDHSALEVRSSQDSHVGTLRSRRHSEHSASRSAVCIGRNHLQAHKKSIMQKAQEDHYLDSPSEGPPEGVDKNESLTASRGAGRRHKRETSRQTSQSQTIDVGTFKMATLCKDLGIGKESSKFAAFTAISARRRKRRKTEEEVVDTNQEHRHIGLTDHESGDLQEETLDSMPAEMESRISRGAPQVRIVNGEIVLDVKSLQVDRAMRDAPADEYIEYVEDNPLEKLVNSRSHSKHKPSPRWDSMSCDMFYKGLSQFGTDFQMISQMFPNRNRRQIKNKFSIEERRNPALIERALAKKEPIDMRQHSVLCDMEFRSIAVLEEELVQLKAKFEFERQEALKDVEKRKSEMLEESITGRIEHTAKVKKRRKRADDGLELVGTIEQVEAQEAEAARIAAESSDET